MRDKCAISAQKYKYISISKPWTEIKCISTVECESHTQKSTHTVSHFSSQVCLRKSPARTWQGGHSGHPYMEQSRRLNVRIKVKV